MNQEKKPVLTAKLWQRKTKKQNNFMYTAQYNMNMMTAAKKLVCSLYLLILRPVSQELFNTKIKYGIKMLL